MKGLRVLAGALLCSAALMRPACAVDRRLGADVAKPTADGSPWTAAQISRLDADLGTMLDTAPTLRGAHVGLLVRETRSGNVLFARNADDAFVPASTLKLLTGSVALAVLTPSYRFRTQALLDAADTTLRLRPAGDPLLAASDLDAMAQALRSAGTIALLGGVRIEPSGAVEPAYPPGWSWDDLVEDYAPVIAPTTIEENVVHLRVSPGPTVGAPVTIVGAPPPLATVGPPSSAPIVGSPSSVAIVGSPSPATIGAGAGGGCDAGGVIAVRVLATTGARGAPATLDLARSPDGCIELVGALPLGGDATTIDAAVPDPAAYLRILAQAALIRANIPTAVGDLPPATASSETGATATSTTGARTASDTDAHAAPDSGARVVWTHDGEPLADLVADMWWPSDNLVAEQLVRAIGRRSSSLPGSTERGVAQERAWLARLGIDPGSVTIVDGSGLSSYDRLTPRALTAILQADWNGPLRDTILDDLPLAGVRGTLAKSFIGTSAAGRTFAKTGSVNHTRGLAGYLATLHHGALTFAWSVDDWMGTDADLATLRGQVLARLIDD